MVQTVGIPREFIAELWEQLEARGWVDGAGQGVTKWAPYASRRWRQEQEKRAKDAANGRGKPAPTTDPKLPHWLVNACEAIKANRRLSPQDIDGLDEHIAAVKSNGGTLPQLIARLETIKLPPSEIGIVQARWS